MTSAPGTLRRCAALAAGTSAAVLAAVLAGVPAAASPLDIPVETLNVGAPCDPGEINRSGMAADGTTVRCVAGVSAEGPVWEPESPGIQQIGRLQGAGFTVVVTRTGTGQRGCTVAEAAAPASAESSPNTINVTLNCPV